MKSIEEQKRYKKSIYNRLNKEEIEDIKELYQNGWTSIQILNKYKEKIKTGKSIIKILRESGINIKGNHKYINIEKENFFEVIDTEEKAYILGFLIADGYVIYPKKKGASPFWGITLQFRDRYILETIKDIIGIDNKITDYQSKHNTQKKRNESSLLVVSQKMVMDLEKYGIVPRKCHIIQFPSNIEDKLIPHLIRGIFDGDGSITVGNVKFSGNEFIPKAIQDILFLKLNIPKHTITCSTYISKKGDITYNYVLKFGAKKDVKAFYEYIYKDATIYLARKKEKFELLDFINPI